MSRMEELNSQYVSRLIGQHVQEVIEWLEEYKNKNNIKDEHCLYCGKEIKKEQYTAYFCEGLTNNYFGMRKCAYEFYCKHREKLLEWATG